MWSASKGRRTSVTTEKGGEEGEREILHRPLLPPGGDSNRAERGGGERNEWLNEAVEDAPIVTVIQLLEYAL